MKKILIILFCLGLSTIAFAQKSKKKDRKVQVIYKYKKFQSFDFEDLVIEGESGGPGDISISPNASIKVKNKLPYRANFNPEIRKGIERVR